MHPRFEAHDESFAKVVGGAPRLAKVVDVDAHEGPVYVASEDALYVTTVPRTVDLPLARSRHVAVKRISLDGNRFPVLPERVGVVRQPANNANGMALGHDGSLLVCEQGSLGEHGAIARLDPQTGRREVVVDHWQGLRFNSPNDVALRHDGSIWFTDPSYGHLQGFKPAPMVGDFVYRFEPGAGRLTVVADDFEKPNGLAFSPDGATLYVTDSGANQAPGSYHVDLPHHVVAYDVVNGRTLVNRRLFCVTTPGFPDGITVDRDGRVYVSAATGVQVFERDGWLIGEIHLPGTVNFTFGGPAGNVLYITTDTAVWAAVLDTTGAPS